MDNLQLKQHAVQIRKNIVLSVFCAQSGHPGGSLSCADILTFLYFEKMNVDIKNPAWQDRDRFVLSKGHCAPAIYASLAQRGFFPAEELKGLRKLGAMLQGHPDMNSIPGVDMSTGSLGQGISAAVGMALAGKLDNKDYKVYTLLGDGEISEGQVWEALMFAAHKKLNNLCVIIDNNNLQIDGTLDEVNSPYPIDEKLNAFGFQTIVINGHDFDEIRKAFAQFEQSEKPLAILAKTIKGKGVSFMEDNFGWHGKAPNKEQYETAMEELSKEEAELCKK